MPMYPPEYNVKTVKYRFQRAGYDLSILREPIFSPVKTFFFIHAQLFFL